MAEKEIITSPSKGSNELGVETSDEAITGISAGSDTQFQLAASSGKKHKKDKNINDDETAVKNKNGESEFLELDETDE